MKHAPTEAQKGAAAERRRKMRELARRIGAMTPDERTRLIGDCSVVAIEGHGFSFFNTLMVITQLPGASVVGGFRQWRAAGRCVRKGEHGAAIWIPITPGRAGGEELPETPDAKPSRGRPRFILGTVFDIAQTDPVQAGAPAAPPELVTA